MKPNKRNSKGIVIDLDPTIVDKEPERVGKRLPGRPENKERKEPLPFKATLAFAFGKAGGKETAIEYARLAAYDDVRFERFIRAYDGLNVTEQGKCRLEDLCATAEISPSQFLGGIAAVAYKHNYDVSRLIAAVNQPAVVEATVESALQPFGTDDRRILHTHAGFLPSPKAPQINVSANAQAASITQAGAISGGGMPKFETDITEVTEAIRGDASAGRIASRPAIPAPILEGDPDE